MLNKTHKAVLTQADKLWHEAEKRINELMPLKLNPQVAGMIVKNQGYMLALEDLTEAIHNLSRK
jgi:hypothetical protein